MSAPPVLPEVTPAPSVPDSRLRAYGQFLAALFYYFLARAIARRGAMGLAGEAWRPVVEQAMLVFLLVLGFAGIGFALNRQMQPIGQQGLPRRPSWTRELGMGLAVGWSAALTCFMVLVIGGGVAIRLQLGSSAWGWLLINLAFYALATLAEEVAFRGYAFQRFARAVGSAGAVLGFSLLYAFLQAMIMGTTRASIAVSFVLNLVLSTAYLRTRALWVGWGLNFGWRATRALLFGLAVSGDSSHSPVVQADPMGPFWLTGGGFGLEGSWLAFVVLLLLLPALYAVTRDLDFLHNAPELIPGGIPVDIDAAARRQHETAMGAVHEPAAPSLVQISPLPAAPGEVKPADEAMPDEPLDQRPAPEPNQTSPEPGNESIPR
jgi:membrane protease YdiL (CAAX protease family)